MKMKIPIIDPTNSNHEPSADYLSSDNSNEPEEIDSPATNDDFSEYLWMENEEEFDKQILQQLEEEALMEHCLEIMLDHESEHGNIQPIPAGFEGFPQVQNRFELVHLISNLVVQDKDELAKQSTLNPNAAEFIPQSRTTDSPLVEKTS